MRQERFPSLPAMWLLTIGLSVCFAGVLATPALAAERRLIEAEDFDGLKLHPPYQEDAPGWYAMFASCRYFGAPGRGLVAMIHDTAKNRVSTKKLDNPLPAGEYQVFLRSCGLSWKSDSRPENFAWLSRCK